MMMSMEERGFENEEDVRAEKPRRYGATEMRGPHYTVLTQNAIQDILESRGQFVDGLKFSGGSHSLFPRDFIKQLTHLAHQHQVYVSTGDWAEHFLRQCQGPSSFKQYVEECKHLGFDTIDLNVSSLKLPEETLLRLVRLIKSLGLRVKPLFALNFHTSDFPVVAPIPHSSASAAEVVEDVDLLLRRAERCLEAGADTIMIDADDLCKYADSLRSDVVAKIVGRLGLEKTMFEASNPKASEWFVRRYGPRVNLFVDHSQVTNLECLRGYNFGRIGIGLLLPRNFGPIFCLVIPWCLGLVWAHLQQILYLVPSEQFVLRQSYVLI